MCKAPFVHNLVDSLFPYTRSHEVLVAATAIDRPRRRLFHGPNHPRDEGVDQARPAPREGPRGAIRSERLHSGWVVRLQER